MPTIAQRLRKDPTPAEVRFWRLIDPLRRQGYHFRKQVGMGPYLVDFACHHARIVVEIDGDGHFTEAGLARDRVRDAHLATMRYRVLRFTNYEVMRNEDGVYWVLEQALEQSELGLARGLRSSVSREPPPFPSLPSRGRVKSSRWGAR